MDDDHSLNKEDHRFKIATILNLGMDITDFMGTGHCALYQNIVCYEGF